MAESSQALQARKATTAAFGELVSAMRGVAASRAQRARELIAGINAYARTVSDAMAQAVSLIPPADTDTAHSPRAAPLRLLFCAEQGFNGGFSEAVLAAVPEAKDSRVMLIGSQGLRLARTRGITPEWSAPLIAHADAVVAASERLHAALAQALLRRPAAEVELVHAELTSGGHFAVVRRRLLPLDRASIATVTDRNAPPEPICHCHLGPGPLWDALATEYVAARLAQALLHSHAAENLARIQAMAAAHDNVSRMVESLAADERQARQEAITAEIIELAAGLRVQAITHPRD